MEAADTPHFRYEDEPGHPGWKRWELRDPTRFNGFLGAILVRREADVARVRMVPEHRHSNLRDHVHGGALLGFVDIALFAGARGLDVITAGPASTVDVSVQFVAGAAIGEAIEARVELVRETGRMLFLRGLIVQEDTNIASFQGVVRKPSQR
ncbi:phenylacetic acid degradation protein [Sphingomonas hengshuiensis]|uniref:Phenylacetic acid degradation protein n=1 Tax=Sphingomonas hengshuiensis TaxID=1609977 RepID=A0A7U5CVA9_9SPHN|nr:phenylacetic acid degradation protein [Sphingomonas hengshuiensis]